MKLVLLLTSFVFLQFSSLAQANSYHYWHGSIHVYGKAFGEVYEKEHPLTLELMCQRQQIFGKLYLDDRAWSIPLSGECDYFSGRIRFQYDIPKVGKINFSTDIANIVDEDIHLSLSYSELGLRANLRLDLYYWGMGTEQFL